MFPDYPHLKRQLLTRLQQLAQERITAEALLGTLGKHRQHEGDRFTLFRRDGSIETSTFQEDSAEAMIDADAIRRGDVGAVHDAVTLMAEQLAEVQAKQFLTIITRVTEEAGTIVRGQGFSAEGVLEALTTMDLSFNDDGVWQAPQWIAHPDGIPKLIEAWRRIDTEPALRAELEDILERKREAWRVREASRTLVD